MYKSIFQAYNSLETEVDPSNYSNQMSLQIQTSVRATGNTSGTVKLPEVSLVMGLQ